MEIFRIERARRLLRNSIHSVESLRDWRVPPDVGPPPTFPIMAVVTGCHVRGKMSHFEVNMHNELVGKPIDRNHHVHRVPGNV